MTFALIPGDCRDALAHLSDNSIDAVVTDPPYGLSKEPDMAEVLRHWLAGDDYEHTGAGFMGKTWDSFVPGPTVWAEVHRVLKPGGHCLVFAGTRTFDMMALALRLAGFEIRDTLSWLYGQGFPKSLDVSKAIDKAAGAEREVVGTKLGLPGYSLAKDEGRGVAMSGNADGSLRDAEGECAVTAPATPEAERQWEGWGTALKPAWEPIIVARKPLAGTVAANVLEHGTGALNIDACRVGTTDSFGGGARGTSGFVDGYSSGDGWQPGSPAGRWPANVVLGHHEDCVQVGERKVRTGTAVKRNLPATGAGQQIHVKAPTRPGADESYGDADGTETVPAWECAEGCPVRLLDEQVGPLTSGAPAVRRESGADRSGNTGAAFGAESRPAGSQMVGYGDTGGASRFFYQAKAAKRERQFGMPEGERNSHPTIKPWAVMEWLVRLVTPPGGVVLDPFCGSGTTGIAAMREGFHFVGCERDEDYAARIARPRLLAAWVEVRDR